MSALHDRLRHHVSGAIERGEAEAITGIDAPRHDYYGHLGMPTWYGVAACPERGDYCITAAWSALNGKSRTAFERTTDVPASRRHADQDAAMAQMRTLNAERF